MATSNTPLFSPSGHRDGLVWFGKCGFLAGVVVVGAVVGYLQETALLMIGGFAFWQGVRPFFLLSVELANDATKCRAEKAELQRVEIDQIESLIQITADDAGTLFVAVREAYANRDRQPLQKTVEKRLTKAEKTWTESANAIGDSAELAPVLGIGGSLIGLLSALGPLTRALQGSVDEDVGNAWAELFGSMGTMVSTTLAGCVAALVLIGLRSKAHEAIACHIADLRLITSLLLSHDDQQGDEPDDDRLFPGGVK